MDTWVWWVIAACALGAGEVLTTGFFLAPFAAGALVAAVVAGVGAGFVPSLIAFVVVAAALLVGVRPIARRHVRLPPALRTGPAALAGHRAVVVDRIDNAHGVGLARIDGELWSARAYIDDRVFDPGDKVEVVEIKGATALVD